MRKRRSKTGEHVNHERWLVSYADFVTLLFALFVVLFASSRHEQKAIETVSRAVKDGLQDLGASRSISSAAVVPEGVQGATKSGAVDASTTAQRTLDVKLRRALDREIEKQQVVLTSTPEGLVISLHEFGFFDSGQATLLPRAGSTIKRIADIVMPYGFDLRVEGHSDNVPIHNTTFNSNWDLSTTRATAVAVMLLNDPKFDPKRLSISGYAEYHPIATNDTAEGRRLNRRVDVVVLSTVSAKPPNVGERLEP